MNLLITGAEGYIGRALVERLVSGEADAKLGLKPRRITLLDQRFTATPTDSRVHLIEADLTAPGVLAKAAEDADLVFHLASIPGGAATKNFELGLQVNLQATVTLLEALRVQERKPRVVFASTIGVYGVPMPAVIDEDTLPGPSMSYGAHKLIGEILINDYSLRGFIDGVALRLPGIVARPPQASGMLSAFISDLIRELSAGREFTCPVAAEGKSWLMSRPCIVENLLHAATLPAQTTAAQRVWLLPVLHASMGELVSAIARTWGDDVQSRVTYKPNSELQAQFSNYPPLYCPKALAAGFRHDGTLEALVERALQ